MLEILLRSFVYLLVAAFVVWALVVAAVLVRALARLVLRSRRHG